MSDAFINGLCLSYLVLCVGDIFLCLRHYDFWKDEWGFFYGPIYTITSFFIAVGMLIQGKTLLCAVYSFYTLLGGWTWWHNDRHKRRRKKLRDRLAGRVRDMGGRLKVIRPNET